MENIRNYENPGKNKIIDMKEKHLQYKFYFLNNEVGLVKKKIFFTNRWPCGPKHNKVYVNFSPIFNT